MRLSVLECDAVQGLALFKAMASEQRLRILELLTAADLNINELCERLGLMHPTVSRHVQVLEEAGLIAADYLPGAQGTQKRCRLCVDRLMITLSPSRRIDTELYEVEMPIGMYQQAEAESPCGLAGPEGLIGLIDQSQSFLHPDRRRAHIAWMAHGGLLYLFPNTLPSTARIIRLEICCEVCSEAPGFRNDYPSDITVCVNETPLGVWTCQGDFGDRRGLLNPDWWPAHNTQYGLWKVWSVDLSGAYLDGERLSDVTLQDCQVEPRRPISVWIGVQPDACHRGGINLLGRGFGNYDKDLLLRLHYRLGSE